MDADDHFGEGIRKSDLGRISCLLFVINTSTTSLPFLQKLRNSIKFSSEFNVGMKFFLSISYFQCHHDFASIFTNNFDGKDIGSEIFDFFDGLQVAITTWAKINKKKYIKHKTWFSENVRNKISWINFYPPSTGTSINQQKTVISQLWIPEISLTIF